MTTTTSRLTPQPATRGRGRTAPVDAAPGPTLLPIGADLLPRGGTTTGRGRRTRAVAVGLVLVAGLGVGGAYVLADQQRTTSVAALTAAQERQRDLRAQQKSLAEVADVQTQATALRAALTNLMATDTPWSTVLTDLANVRGGVTFTGVQGTVTDPASATGTTGNAVTTPGAVGTLVINGAAADKPTVAAFVEALAGVTGFADPFLSTVATASGEAAGGYTFTVTVALTGDLRTAATSRWSTGAAGTSSTGGGK